MSNRAAVLVTGVSTGIGQAAALALQQAGYLVFGTVRREADGRELAAAGCRILVMDVTDPEAVRRAGAEVSESIGDRPFLGLINNAGIVSAGPVEIVDLDAFRRVMEVNLFGVISVCQTFLPLLRKSGGRIINISSISGLVAAPFLAPYATSKFALEALSDSLRRELKPLGCHVIAIEPGPIDTPIWDKTNAPDEEKLQGTVYQKAFERFGESVHRSAAEALPVERVSEAVLSALTARRPPTRIVISKKRWFFALLPFLPTRLVDFLASKR